MTQKPIAKIARIASLEKQAFNNQVIFIFGFPFSLNALKSYLLQLPELLLLLPDFLLLLCDPCVALLLFHTQLLDNVAVLQLLLGQLLT